MTDQVRSVVVRLSANTAAYLSQMKAAGTETKVVADGMARSVTASGAAQEKALRGVATTAKFATGAVVVGFAAAIKESSDFAAKMALVQTLAHANRREMDLLSNAALNVGQKYGYTATQVGDAEAELVKAGISVKDILGGSLTGALTLAAAGQTDVATATEVAAAAMTQFRLKGKDVPHIADLLAAGADKALGSVTDLGFALSHAGLTAHQFKIPIEDTVGTLTAFAQAGLIGERAGTTFQQVLLRLASAQGAHLKLMDHYGLSLYKANGQIKTMPELAENLRRSFEHLAPAERNHALAVIFGQRAIQGANVLLAEGGKGIQSWINKVNDQGFAAQQASGKLDSLAGDLTKLKAAGETAFIELGSSGQGPLRQLVQDTTAEINKITKNGDLQRWAGDITRDFESAGRAALPLAADVGGVLKALGSDAKHVADAFNSLPADVQKILVTGGLLAYGANKLGVLKPTLNALKGGGLGSSIISKAAPVPVFVTNEGFGLPGAAGGGGAGGTATGVGEGLGISALLKGGAGAGGKVLTEFGLGQVLKTALPKAFSFGSLAVGTFSYGDKNAEVRNPTTYEQQILDDARKHPGKYVIYEGKIVLKAQLDKWQADGIAAILSGPYGGPSHAPKAGVPASLAKPATKMPFGATGPGQTADSLGGILAGALSTGAKDTLKQTANDAAAAKKQVDDLIYAETHGPKKVSAHVELPGIGDALNNVMALGVGLRNLHDKTVSLHIKVFGKTDILGTAAGLLGPHSADGNTVPGIRHPYGDKVLMPLAPGEEVISNRHGQADKWRPFLKHINAGLADGGTARHGMSLPAFLRSEFDLKLPETLKQWNHALALSTNAITNETTARDNLISQRDQLSSTVSSAFQPNIFDTSNRPANWAWLSQADKNKQILGGGNPIAALNASTAQANQFDALLKKLDKEGLKGGAFTALAQTGDLATAQAYATETPAQIRALTAAFNRNQAATARVGRDAGQLAYGKQIAADTKHLKAMASELTEIKKEIAAYRKEHKNDAAIFGNKINAAASNATRGPR